MKRYSHLFLTIFAALVLSLTSLQMAVARGAPNPVGTMVICSGMGPVTVLVDDKGQPTGAVHICPDAALALFAAAHETPPAVVGQVVEWRRVVPALHPSSRVQKIRQASSARGPPFPV